jgi:predicted transcriptional regulator
MRKSKLDTPHIRKQVVKELVTGKSQNKIAKEIGLHQSQISRWSNKEDIRILIEQEQERLLEAVPDAVENVKSLVREMKTIPKKDIKRRELSYKASKDVLKSVGLLPTPIQSQTFVNLYQHNQTALSPIILQLLAKHSEKAIDFETVNEDDIALD